ncbi:MAG: response regulator [Rhodospirillales bacterium]|nr:response regulator [Acetobacter sp.]
MSSGGGAERHPVVLIVEDEPILIMVMQDLVEEAGCGAIVTNNVEAAISILEQRTDIRVVFADLDVRGTIMGLRLAAMIRDRWPPIELVLTGALAPELDRIPARGVFCPKPFQQARVVAAIRSFAA